MNPVLPLGLAHEPINGSHLMDTMRSSSLPEANNNNNNNNNSDTRPVGTTYTECKGSPETQSISPTPTTSASPSPTPIVAPLCNSLSQSMPSPPDTVHDELHPPSPSPPPAPSTVSNHEIMREQVTPYNEEACTSSQDEGEEEMMAQQNNSMEGKELRSHLQSNGSTILNTNPISSPHDMTLPHSPDPIISTSTTITTIIIPGDTIQDPDGASVPVTTVITQDRNPSTPSTPLPDEIVTNTVIIHHPVPPSCPSPPPTTSTTSTTTTPTQSPVPSPDEVAISCADTPVTLTPTPTPSTSSDSPVPVPTIVDSNCIQDDAPVNRITMLNVIPSVSPDNFVRQSIPTATPRKKARCVACSEVVSLTERVILEGKTYHASCTLRDQKETTGSHSNQRVHPSPLATTAGSSLTPVSDWMGGILQDPPSMKASSSSPFSSSSSKLDESPQKTYPTDLNPFGDDDEGGEDEGSGSIMPSTSTSGKEPIYPKDLNPFGEDEEEANVTLSSLGSLSISKYDNSLNPFGDDDEDEEREEASVTTRRPIFSTPNPIPKPRRMQNTPPSSSTPSRVPSIRSIDSNRSSMPRSLRMNRPSFPPPPAPSPSRKRPAPPPPTAASTPISSTSDGESKPPLPSKQENQSSSTSSLHEATLSPVGVRKVSLTPSVASNQSSTAHSASTPDDSFSRCNSSMANSINGSGLGPESGSEPNSLTRSEPRKKRPAPPPPTASRRTVGGSTKEIEVDLSQIGDRVGDIARDVKILEESFHNNPEQERDDLVFRYLELAREECILARKQEELMFQRREHKLEEEHADIEYEIRQAGLIPPFKKTSEDEAKESKLLERLVECIDLRNDVIENMTKINKRPDFNKKIEKLKKMRQPDQVDLVMERFLMKYDLRPMETVVVTSPSLNQSNGSTKEKGKNKGAKHKTLKTLKKFGTLGRSKSSNKLSIGDNESTRSAESRTTVKPNERLV